MRETSFQECHSLPCLKCISPVIVSDFSIVTRHHESNMPVLHQTKHILYSLVSRYIGNFENIFFIQKYK